MFRNALVCLDGTAGNQACQAAAIHFAKHYLASLTGLHVREPLVMTGAASLGQGSLGESFVDYSLLTTDWELEQGKLEQSAFGSFVHGAQAAGVVAVTESATGTVLDEISRHAMKADIIFMGRGQDPQDSLLGSVVAAVVRKGEKPFVLASDMIRTFSKVMVAFDGSPGSYRALGSAADIVTSWKRESAELRVLIVDQDTPVAEQRRLAAESYLDSYGLSFNTLVTRGEPSAVIPAAAEEWETGLLCMGAYGHSLLREMMLGSTTQAVVSQWRQPLLLCH